MSTHTNGSIGNDGIRWFVGRLPGKCEQWFSIDVPKNSLAKHPHGNGAKHRIFGGGARHAERTRCCGVRHLGGTDYPRTTRLCYGARHLLLVGLLMLVSGQRTLAQTSTGWAPSNDEPASQRMRSNALQRPPAGIAVPTSVSEPRWMGSADSLADQKCPPERCLPGWRGRPYRDRTLACGVECENRYAQSHGRVWETDIHPHWPRPFSSFWDSRFPGSCCPHAEHPSGMGSCKSCGHLLDRLDPLANIKLLPSPRHDNGYCGPGRDPFGKLGLSHQGVTGTTQDALPSRPSPQYPEPAPGPLPREDLPTAIQRTTFSGPSTTPMPVRSAGTRHAWDLPSLLGEASRHDLRR